MATYVVSHANCFDGMGAAWAAYKKFGNSATYLFLDYHEEHKLPSFTKDDTVYFTDLSSKRDFTLALAEKVKQLIIIDHHETAEKELTCLCHKNLEVNFNMKLSGAEMAWRYFHPNTPIPRLIDFIGDRDLWNFHLPETKAFTVSLGLEPMTIESYDRVASLIEEPKELKAFISPGQAILTFEAGIISASSKIVRIVDFQGYKVAAVNFGPALRSEMGNYLVDNYPDIDFAICWWQLADGSYSNSFRSRKDGVNVSQICTALGGGGHAAAASCKTKEKIV